MAESPIVARLMEGVKPENIAPASIHPYYDCTQKGVYFVGVDKGEHTAPQWLSDAIYLVGRGADGEGNHYRIIEWQDRLTRETRRSALPMATIGTQQGWQRLQGMGITILASRRKRELLADYLQAEGSNAVWTVTGKAGWLDGAYILPSGDIIQKEDARILYDGDTSQKRFYQPKGSLADWQAHIARLAAGNSRLCLALGTAFAAPLMRLLDIEGGGFHLYGDSSDGKTTAAKVALSVWGAPDDLKTTWEGTGHGFANLAAARNDGLLVLDEIGQAAPRVVAHTAYSVINGTGKVQGHKDGGNREIHRWRVLLLSTGEKTLDGYLKAGGSDWHAGQANRLPAIPANAGKGLGIFDTLHGFQGGAALAEHLNHAGSLYHGTAGRVFIESLIADPTASQKAQDTLNAFMASLPSLTGQARRVGKRFALVAAALELASPVTGLAPGVGSAGIRQCFDDWHADHGSGKYEDARIIEQAEDFMQRHAHTARFIDWNAAQAWADHAGYRKRTEQGDDVEYWIIPPVFVDEICKGFDKRKVCDVLHGIGWLKRGSDRRYQFQRVNRGRFYVLLGVTPPEPLDDE